MFKYILKRLGTSLLTLIIILTIVFILVRQMPIEGYFDNFDKLDQAVIDARLQQMGLRDPIFVQLKDFFVRLFQGDLGRSARYSVGRPITAIIASMAAISAFLELEGLVFWVGTSPSSMIFGGSCSMMSAM